MKNKQEPRIIKPSTRNKATLPDRGPIYASVILTTVIFGGYILRGCALPNDEMGNRLISQGESSNSSRPTEARQDPTPRPRAATTAGSTTGESCPSVSVINGDMTLPHEGLELNNPYAAKFSSGVVEIPNDQVADIGARYLAPWGAAARDTTDSQDTNTAVEIRNFQAYILSKSTGQWSIQRSFVPIDGLFYLTGGNSTTSANATLGPGGGIQVRVPQAYTYHFWMRYPEIPINPNDIGGVFVSVEARLLVADRNRPDDRNIAKYVVEVGGDYRSAPGSGNFVGETGGGRYKYVSNDWRVFTFATADAEALQKNPPPPALQCR